HVNALGEVTGPANGEVIFGSSAGTPFVGAAADGTGGLLVATADPAGALVQRLDATLAPRFGTGARIEALPVDRGVSLAAAGDGGAFVAWADGSSDAAAMRVQRLDASGTVATGWPAAGAIAATATHLPGTTQVVADGTGGACVAWVAQQAGTAEPN